MSVGEEFEDNKTDGLKLEEKSDKADSGMDDDSQPFNEQGDEDDEEVVTRKPKLKKAAIFDDDEDSDDPESGTKDENPAPTSFKTADQVLDAVMNDKSDLEQDDGSSSDEDNETLLSTIKKKVIKRTSIESDSEDGGDKEEINESQPNVEKKSIFGNSDLFDAEEDSECNDRNSGDETASDSNHEGEDEGFDEASIDPKLLKKLKKGASKKASKPKKKVEQEEKMKLHSETQRIIRESRVSIPYHKPAPKPLQDFLARATNKQQQYRALRGAKDSTKAKAVEEILSKTRLTVKDDKEQSDKSASKPNEAKVVLGKPKIVKEDDKERDTSPDKSKVESQTTDTLDKNGSTDCDVDREDDCDSLPDLTDHVTESKESHVIRETMDVDNSEQSNSANICTDSINNTEIDKTESESKPCVDTDSEQKNVYTCNSQNDSETLSSENKENECSEIVNNDTHACDSPKLSSKKLLILSDLPSLPKLSSGAENFIDLEDTKVALQKPGVNKLMDRFMEHSKKKHKHVPKDVELSIVQKEKGEMDKEELKLNTFVYHVTEEKEDSMSQFDAPGAKLVALKEKLQQKMKLKREEHRKQRQEVFDMDNEEGYGEEEEDKVLDNDEEMTDESDTDVEDDEFDKQFGDEEFEEEEEKEKNPFCDDEAEEDDDDDEMELRLHLSDDDDEKGDNDGDDEDDDDDIKPRRPSSLKKKPKVLNISDDEESKLSVPEKQDQDTESTNNTEKQKDEYDESVDEDNFTPFSKHISGMDITQPQPKKTLSLPIEESQELCGPTLNTSQGSNFYIDESQMLDADGFLKFGSEKKPQQQASISPNFKNLLQTQESGDMDELIGLCSGRFAEDDKKTSCKSLFGLNTENTQSVPGNTQGNMDELLGLCSGKFVSKKVNTENTQSVPGNTQGNMDELLGLCSGKFVSNTQATQQPVSNKRKADFDEESNSSLRMDSEVEEEDFVVNDKNTFSDDEGDEIDGDTDSVHSEKQIHHFKGLKAKSGKIRKEFVDEEAELSGSEYDSDENMDLAEEDDIMEEELGDNDVTATEEELRNQVGRAHLKQMIDDDKRELMRFQEMYLPDGDLHSDAGRMRRFKWNEMDDDTQQDIFNDKSDDEKEEEEGEEAQWRKDRYEREKWLQEQQENENPESEDSQFLKLGKVFLKRRDSDSSLLKKPEAPSNKTTKQPPGTSVPKLSSQRRGSFLGRDKDTLAKIANMAKAVVNPSGARNSGKFVFQVISPEKDSQSMPAPSEPKVKKTINKQPPAKKPRLERSASFSQSSIFNHL